MSPPRTFSPPSQKYSGYVTNGNTSTTSRIITRTTTTMASPLFILPHLAPYLSVAGRWPQYIPFETPAKRMGLRKSGAPCGTPPVEALQKSSLHHSAHATACGHSRHIFLGLGHDDVRGHDEASDGSGVLQCGARDHRRVGYTGRDEVLVLANEGVEADVAALGTHLVDHDEAVGPRVAGDLADRLLEGTVDDPGARPLVTVEGVEQIGHRLLGVQECHATTGDDALLQGRAGRRERVLDAVLLLLELRLGCGAHLDDGHAAGELGEPLLELLAVEVRVGGLDLGADLVDAAGDPLGLAGTVDDGGLVLGDNHLAGTPELVELGVLQLEAELLGYNLAARKDSDVLEHPLAPVTEAGSLDRGRVERATQLVNDQGRQSLALDVLGEDEQRLVGLHDLVQKRQHVLDVADLLVGDQDVGVVENGLHTLLVRHEVRTQIALVELHPLGELQVHPEGLRLLDVDHAVLADLVDGVGDNVADLLRTGRDGTDARDLFLATDLGGLALYGLDRRFDGLVDAATQNDGVGPGSNVLEALADDDLGQNGRCSGPVAGYVIGLGRDLFDELGTLVLEDVLELDLPRDRHAIIRDRRRTELLVEHHVLALGT